MTPTKMVLPSANTEEYINSYMEQLQHRIAKAWETARDHLKASKEAERKYYDRRLVLTSLEVGIKVYKYDPQGRKGLVTKLLKHWVGPYIITKLNETNAWIQPLGKPGVDSKCIHLNMLRMYSGPTVPPEDALVFSDDEERDGRDYNAAGSPAVTEEPAEILNDATALGLAPDDPGKDEEEQQEITPEHQNTRYELRHRPTKTKNPDFVTY